MVLPFVLADSVEHSSPYGVRQALDVLCLSLYDLMGTLSLAGGAIHRMI